MSKQKTNGTPKATTVQLRLRPAEKAVIARAAEVRKTTLSKFMLENAYQAAQQVLADQVHFTLSAGAGRHSVRRWTRHRENFPP